MDHKKNTYKKSGFNKNLPTLFRNKEDLKGAVNTVKNLLIDIQEGNSDILEPDTEGFVKIRDVAEYLRGYLDYVNTTHIIEIFFKDPDKKILINSEDRVKYKVVKFVKPPERLFFGTIEKLKDKMLDSGLRSKTKGYIKLYDTEDRAIDFASKFATDPDDKVTTIIVDAEKAFSDGSKFSTYIEGEYITSQVNEKYLLKGNNHNEII